MQANLTNLTYEVEVAPGEKLMLPQTLLDNIGPGHWVITIRPSAFIPPLAVRNHAAFLNSYAPEDEGLYDDYTAG